MLSGAATNVEVSSEPPVRAGGGILRLSTPRTAGVLAGQFTFFPTVRIMSAAFGCRCTPDSSLAIIRVISFSSRST